MVCCQIAKNRYGNQLCYLIFILTKYTLFPKPKIKVTMISGRGNNSVPTWGGFSKIQIISVDLVNDIYNCVVYLTMARSTMILVLGFFSWLRPYFIVDFKNLSSIMQLSLWIRKSDVTHLLLLRHDRLQDTWKLKWRLRKRLRNYFLKLILLSINDTALLKCIPMEIFPIDLGKDLS